MTGQRHIALYQYNIIPVAKWPKDVEKKTTEHERLMMPLLFTTALQF